MGEEPTFQTGRSHSRPVALNLEPSPLAWICLPPGINPTLGLPLARGSMIRSQHCCLCRGPLPDRPAYRLDGPRICRSQDEKEGEGGGRCREGSGNLSANVD